MRKILINSSLLFSAVVLSGCQIESGFTISHTQTHEQVPPEVLGGGGGWKETTKSEGEIYLKACYPDCSKTKLVDELKKFNLLITQSSTYSSPAAPLAYLKIYNSAGNIIAENSFPVTTIGNQTKLTNAADVGDWIHQYANNEVRVSATIYFSTEGFSGASEYVTYSMRSGLTTIEIDGMQVEINCGPDASTGQPSEFCRLQ
jgi:hypothetical protein